MLLVLAGCGDDPVGPEPPVDSLFERYVALGNSITAGVQGDGINSETQLDAYPVLLAERMGTDFGIPAIRMPGCPAPFTNPITRERLDGASPQSCGLRESPIPVRVHNLAVPGAGTIDLLTNFHLSASPNVLTQLFLGGRSQIEAAERLNPTFASLWIGNNEILGPAIDGIVIADSLVSVETFQARYETVLDRLEGAGARGGVVLGVADVTLIPHLSSGAHYWDAVQEGLLPPGFHVSEECAPASEGGIGEEVLVPFAYGFGVLVAGVLDGVEQTLDCLRDLRVLSAREIEILLDAMVDYNAIIASEAEARGWAYLDPNTLFRALLETGHIPPFPLLDTPESLFGPLFSLDGIHPSSLAHRELTNALIDEVNRTYGTSLAPL